MKVQRFTFKEEQAGYKVCDCKDKHVLVREIRKYDPDLFIKCSECMNFVLTQKDFANEVNK